MSDTFLITYAFVLVLAFVVCCLDKRRYVILRFFFAALMFGAVAIATSAMNDYKGWPAEVNFQRGRLIGVNIVNPGVSTNGHIYVWLYPKANDEPDTWLMGLLYSQVDPAPLNFDLPYTKKSAKQFKDAQAALDNGSLVSIDRNGYNNGRRGNKGKKSTGGPHDGADEGGGSESKQGSGSADGGDDSRDPLDQGFKLKITKQEDLLQKDDVQ